MPNKSYLTQWEVDKLPFDNEVAQMYASLVFERIGVPEPPWLSLHTRQGFPPARFSCWSQIIDSMHGYIGNHFNWDSRSCVDKHCLGVWATEFLSKPFPTTNLCWAYLHHKLLEEMRNANGEGPPVQDRRQGDLPPTS